MKRYLLLLLPVFLATALAAGGPTSTADSERAQRLHRNLRLIEVLVEGGLGLAGDEEPLKRADRCGTMAKDLAREIRQATDGRDAPRIVELGRHLRNLLEQGVASNLTLARNNLPPGSADEEKLQAVRNDAARMALELEDQLLQVVDADPQAGDRAEIRKALEGIQEGRFQVEKVVKPAGGPKKENGKTEPHTSPSSRSPGSNWGAVIFSRNAGGN